MLGSVRLPFGDIHEFHAVEGQTVAVQYPLGKDHSPLGLRRQEQKGAAQVLAGQKAGHGDRITVETIFHAHHLHGWRFSRFEHRSEFTQPGLGRQFAGKDGEGLPGFGLLLVSIFKCLTPGIAQANGKANGVVDLPESVVLPCGRERLFGHQIKLVAEVDEGIA